MKKKQYLIIAGLILALVLLYFTVNDFASAVKFHLFQLKAGSVSITLFLFYAAVFFLLFRFRPGGKRTVFLIYIALFILPYAVTAPLNGRLFGSLPGPALSRSYDVFGALTVFLRFYIPVSALVLDIWALDKLNAAETVIYTLSGLGASLLLIILIQPFIPEGVNSFARFLYDIWVGGFIFQITVLLCAVYLHGKTKNNL